MGETKTKPTGVSVEVYINGIEDESRRNDCKTLIEWMRQATQSTPKMWGPSIVGFGTYHYKYESGREGDWFRVGFSSRKRDLTIYLMAGFDPVADLLAKLGKHKTGKCCLYLKSLDSIDTAVLKKLIAASVQYTRKIAR
ncbi:MAG: hypothetical protein AMXMBFR84_23200 [Candidatus Hydrogenedentota bacterium]